MVGSDEQSALLVDFETERCTVFGKGGVTLLIGATNRRFEANETFTLHELGRLRRPDLSFGLPADIWRTANEANEMRIATASPNLAVQSLLAERERLRQTHRWAEADHLRLALLDLGWLVDDTANSPRLRPIDGRGLPNS